VRGFVLLVCLAAPACAQNFYNYVGQVDSHSVLLAWGVTGPPGNTIGRDSTPMGKAVVRIANRTLPAGHNWVVAGDLAPDTVYPYEIDIDGTRRGGGQVRTWPVQSTHFCFFVIGDFGNGNPGQFRVADLMSHEFERRGQTNCPVRFILTVGDNIYGDANLGVTMVRSGDQDAHWETKFFKPYNDLLRQIPFLPTLGNHDGNGSENRGDLFVYLDNFFFPGNKPARWYTFTYGGFAQFFALDSTINTETGPAAPIYTAGGAESTWLSGTLAASQVQWKIPYFHHPIYNAGPRHPASYNDLRHWVDLFEKDRVKVVFSGHEHNFQFSNTAETGGILYVVTGSGGELRPGDVRRNMNQQHVAGWAAMREFLSVEIDGPEMRITPLSPDGVSVVDRDKHPIPLPIVQRTTP
jgi:tartrate-resistant acid phosphatase type 5